MDSAPVHTAVTSEKFCDTGYNPIHLPPWSPLLNPIEECFSKLKMGVQYKLEIGILFNRIIWKIEYFSTYFSSLSFPIS
jgi:transposase